MSILGMYFNNIGESGQNPQFVYIDTNNTLTEVTATGFLNESIANKQPLSQSQMALVTTRVTPNSKTTHVNLFNINLFQGQWSLIAPINTIKSAGVLTTVGGSATESFEITGIDPTTDIVFVQTSNNGANNVTILETQLTFGELVINFSGDPGSSFSFYYQIVRKS